MDRYRKYARNKFKLLKQRVSKRIPDLVIEFYNGSYRHCEDHVLLGKVIHWINSCSYSLVDVDFKPTDSMHEMSDQIILEMFVQELFNKVYSKKKQRTLTHIP